MSGGRMIFFGPCSGLVPWLSGHLGYTYEPRKGGIAPDYVMDLVNIAFSKPEVGGWAERRRGHHGGGVGSMGEAWAPWGFGERAVILGAGSKVKGLGSGEQGLGFGVWIDIL